MHLDGIKAGSWFLFKSLDLTGIGHLTIRTGSTHQAGHRLEVRTGSLEGPIIAAVAIPFTSGNREDWSETKFRLAATNGIHDLYFTFSFDGDDDKAFVTFDWVRFHGEGGEMLTNR
jgi:cytochrome c